MALTQVVIQTTTGVASGNVDFTSPGFGLPEAAIVIVGQVAGAAGNIALSYGFTDGTNQRVSAVSHGQGAALGRRFQSRSNIYQLSGETEGGSFDSFVADGIRLNFPIAPSGDRPMTIILFKGGQFSVGDRLITSGVESVALGFQPNLVFTSCVGMNTLDSVQTHGIFSLGVIHEDAGTVSQYTAAYRSNGTSRSIAGAVGAWATCQIFSGTTPTWSATMENFSATGFDFNTSGSAGDLVHYLAIDSLGAGVNVEQVSSSPTISSVANTTPGFTPDFLMMFSTGNFSLGAVSDGDFRALYGVSANSSSISLAADVSAAPELSETYNSTMVTDLNLMNGGGTSDFVKSTLTSFDATGYTLNYTAVTGTPRLLIGVTIEAPAVGTVIEVPTGVVDIAALAPTLQLPIIVNPPSGLIALAGLAPTIVTPISITVSSGVVSIAGLAPIINLPVNIAGEVGVINLAGLAPSISSEINIDVGLGVVNIIGLAPQISLPVDIAGEVGVINIAGLAPSITSEITITVPAGAVSIGGAPPLIGLPLSITIPNGLVQLTGLAPSISSEINIDIGVGVVGIAGLPPSVELGVGIDVPPGSVVINGLAPSLSLPISITTPSGLITLTGLTPTIDSLGGIITPSERVIIQVDIDRVIFVVNIDQIIIINN